MHVCYFVIRKKGHSMELTPREEKLFAVILEAANNQTEVPLTLQLSPLVKKRWIRAETFIVNVNKSITGRVVTIIHGDHRGKQTRRHAWIKKNQTPSKILDERDIQVIRKLGLLAPCDVGRSTTNSVKLEIPDWDNL